MSFVAEQKNHKVDERVQHWTTKRSLVFDRGQGNASGEIN